MGTWHSYERVPETPLPRSESTDGRPPCATRPVAHELGRWQSWRLSEPTTRAIQSDAPARTAPSGTGSRGALGPIAPRGLGGQSGGEPEADRVVVLGAGAGLRAPEGARGQELAGVDRHALGPRVEPDAAQGVVELVAQEHAAHAQLVQLVQAAVDVGHGAAGVVQHLPAAERFGGLHSEYDGELALLDDLARLIGLGDDPEPALAGAAVHGVAVVLEFVRLLYLEPDRGHLVAAAVLEEVERAEGSARTRRQYAGTYC